MATDQISYWRVHLPKSKITIFTFLIQLLLITAVTAQKSSSIKDPLQEKLPLFPLLLKKEERLAGNPLATYAEMARLENEYKMGPFAMPYQEIRLNFEEFLGFPNAGKHAMRLPQFKITPSIKEDTLASSWSLYPAIDIIKEEAQKTRIVIWGEEHHLPQTRSLYELMIRELWNMGYQYLAAETFTEGLSDSTSLFVNYNSGYYTADPIFASAINYARTLGFKLIDYDTKEQSPTEPSLRDIRQAENIYQKVFQKDKNAKVLIIAGRGHVSETITSNGWKPMAYNLKQLTGINPFTLYTPTMTERLTKEEEHPLYRQATFKHPLNQVSIFKNTNSNSYLGTESFDAYVFFPRTEIAHGRPNWMYTTMKRKIVKNPFMRLSFDDDLLVQVFDKNQPVNTIPVDQFLISSHDKIKSLALPSGKYYARAIDKNSKVISQKKIRVN